MTAYYNEFDPHAAEWLRELMKADQITPGVVDERSIAAVGPTDVVGRRAHFFAGIGGWDLALRLAGWPADRPVWTGSCPCQPYSAAGKGLGDADPRSLWPELFRLIRECRPECVFGEQVARAIGHGWLDRVCADLEGEGYAVGAAVLGAHSALAPHIRQRLYWVAYREGVGHGGCEASDGRADEPDGLRPTRPVADAGTSRVRAGGRGTDAGATGGDQGSGDQRKQVRADAGDGRASGRGVGDADRGQGAERDERPARGVEAPQRADVGGSGLRDGDAERLGSPNRSGLPAPEREELCGPPGREEGRAVGEPGGSFWSDYALIPCRDGKARRTQPGLFPLADGIPGRVGMLRGYGNAIVPQTAALFIKAFLETESGVTDGGMEA